MIKWRCTECGGKFIAGDEPGEVDFCPYCSGEPEEDNES